MSPRLLASKLGPSLATAQLVGWLLLLRSVAFDRWMTVAVSVLMLVGVRAAMRERTWGVVLAFAAATWLPAAVLLGMAPPWFLLAGVLGMMPFLKTWPSFREVDKGAATMLGTLAAALGAFGALGWKAAAPALFDALPALQPSFLPGHSFALAAILAVATTLGIRDRRARARYEQANGVRVAAEDAEEEPVRARIGEPVRVAPETEHDEASLAEVDRALEDDVDPPVRRQKV